MFFIMLLRSAAGINSDGSTELPCSSIMRTSRSYIWIAVAAQTGDRQLGEAETIVHERRLQVLDPDGIELALLGVFVRASSRNDALPPASLP